MVSFENILSKITIQDVVLVILVILVIYLMFKSNSSNSNNENFDTSSSNTDAIDCTQSPVQDMTSLATIADMLTQANTPSGGTINIPSKNVIIPDTLTVTGDLTANGTVTFTNKNNMIMEIFPKFMILAWGSWDIPLGWAVCDGQFYIKNADGSWSVPISNIEKYSQQTPNLLGRFIRGARTDDPPMNGIPISPDLFPAAEYPFTDQGADPIKYPVVGGVNNTMLIRENLPPHQHFIGPFWGGSETLGTSGWAYQTTNNASVPQEYLTMPGGVVDASGNQINTQAFDIDPPYYSLIYIMKM